jgi:hypothetical protein
MIPAPPCKSKVMVYVSAACVTASEAVAPSEAVTVINPLLCDAPVLASTSTLRFCPVPLTLIQLALGASATIEAPAASPDMLTSFAIAYLPAASKVSDVGDSVIADFLYCVTPSEAVAPSDAVIVIVDVRLAVVLVYAAAVTVTVAPETDTVNQVSPEGAEAVNDTPVESPETVNVFAIFFSC